MITTYCNPFHNPNYTGSTPLITTEAVPVEYKGFLIYHRNPFLEIWDIVKDMVCVGMYAGLGGAKRRIDTSDSEPFTKL